MYHLLKIFSICHHISILAEYGAGGQASVAGDAYSFGVTLLEMFTGKAPTDDMFTEGLTLHLLAEAGLPDKIPEIIDPEILLDELHDDDSGDTHQLLNFGNRSWCFMFKGQPVRKNEHETCCC